MRAAPLVVFIVVIVALIVLSIVERVPTACLAGHLVRFPAPTIPWPRSSQSLVFCFFFLVFKRIPRRLKIDISVAPVAGVLVLLAASELSLDDIRKGVAGDERIKPYHLKRKKNKEEKKEKKEMNKGEK